MTLSKGHLKSFIWQPTILPKKNPFQIRKSQKKRFRNKKSGFNRFKSHTPSLRSLKVPLKKGNYYWLNKKRIWKIARQGCTGRLLLNLTQLIILAISSIWTKLMRKRAFGIYKFKKISSAKESLTSDKYFKVQHLPILPIRREIALIWTLTFMGILSKIIQTLILLILGTPMTQDRSLLLVTIIWKSTKILQWIQTIILWLSATTGLTLL